MEDLNIAEKEEIQERPADTVRRLVGEAFDLWVDGRPGFDLERMQIVGRSATWVGPLSVEAGVGDVLAGRKLDGTALIEGLIKAIKQAGGYGLSGVPAGARKTSLG